MKFSTLFRFEVCVFMELYDKRALYNEQIKPLIQEIEQRCVIAEIPFFFTAAVANSEKNTEYASAARTALPMGIHLRDDQFINHVKVSAGFEVIMPDEIPTIEL